MSYTYKLTHTDVVLRVEDGAHIPNDPDNADRIAYNKFLADGGTPLPADPAVVSAPGVAEAQAARQDAASLDDLARANSQVTDPATRASLDLIHQLLQGN